MEGGGGEGVSGNGPKPLFCKSVSFFLSLIRLEEMLRYVIRCFVGLSLFISVNDRQPQMSELDVEPDSRAEFMLKKKHSNKRMSCNLTNISWVGAAVFILAQRCTTQ